MARQTGHVDSDASPSSSATETLSRFSPSPASPATEGGNATPQQHLGHGEPAWDKTNSRYNIDAQPPITVMVPASSDLSVLYYKHKRVERERRDMVTKVICDSDGQHAAKTAQANAGSLSYPPPDDEMAASSALSSPVFLSHPGINPPANDFPNKEGTAALMIRRTPSPSRWGWDMSNLDQLPNELLTHILGFLDVNDLLATSRINHHFRTLSLHPILHHQRLQRARLILPPLLTSPSRPTLAELIARHIFVTHTTQISRTLARNLVAIRLSRRLPLRPSAETLVERGVLPPETVVGSVAPGLVARKRAVEKEKLKDGLRRWVGGVWRGEVRERSKVVKACEEKAGVGRVWKLRRFWERVGKEGQGMGVGMRRV
ncbi:hypothetical protein F4778DRAFT_777608 [Xylariomycetidae sp. FL2044]|nr:hypothetical protein F4778DRAFT_777608 [Xylariomycetidae sp. FL2044]